MKKRSDFIAVNEPYLHGNEKKYLNQCIDDQWISSTGNFVRSFEDALCRLTNRKYAVTTSSGTTALAMALELLELPKESEVITSNFSIIACSNAIIQSGLVPVFIDPSLETFNIDAESIEKAITPKTSAILLPHIYGLPCDMDPILELCKKYNLKLIEDAAQMHGQMYKDRPCGSFGDISIFSFYANKLITTGEGGAILTNNEDYAQRANSLKDHMFSKERRFLHHGIGYNYRMTNLQAAVGLAQYEQIDHFVKEKRKLGTLYNERLIDLDNQGIIKLPIQKTAYAQNIYWAYTLVLDKYSGDNIDVINKLREFNIDARPSFYPLSAQPAYKQEGYYCDNQQKYPTSFKLSERCLYIPSGIGLSTQKVDYICDVIKKMCN